MNILRLEGRTFSGWSDEHSSGWSDEHSQVGVMNILRLEGRTFSGWSDEHSQVGVTNILLLE